MFDFIYNTDIDTLYSVCGITGVTLLIIIGKFIAKRTETTADDEVIKALQKSHAENVKRKVADNIKKVVDDNK